MRKIFFLWLFATSLTYGQKFSVDWCSAPFPEKIKLETALNRLTIHADNAAVEQVITTWAKSQKIKPLVIVSKGKLNFSWPFQGNGKVGFTQTQGTTLGGRKTHDFIRNEPTSAQLRSFFADTTIVMDTLRFFVGLNNNAKIILKIASRDYILPYVEEDGEVLVCPSVIFGVSYGQYTPFSLFRKIDTEIETITDGKIYFLSKDEKGALLTAVNQRKLNINCQELLEETVSVIYEVWGGKSIPCEEYDQEQLYSIQQIAKCH